MQIWCRKLVLTNWCFFGFDQFQGAFLSTCFLAQGLALFQQFVDDASSVDGQKQDLKVAQSAKVDSATVPLQHHQFELPMDGKDDLETFSMPVSPHDRDVMHKARGGDDVTGTSGTAILQLGHVEKFCQKF